jgi:hypothetical protein
MSKLRGKYSGILSLDDLDDPMNTRNHVVKRAFINDAVLCSVVLAGGVKHLDEHKRFDAAEYARQAFKKFGKCRVFFFKPGNDVVWREIRWKNANVGTLYRRPSFMTVPHDEVPPELQVAMLCAG